MDRENYKEVQRKTKTKIVLSSILSVILVLLVLLVVTNIYVIDDGEVGVYKKLGSYSPEEIQTGIHMKTPFISDVYKVSTKKVTNSQALNVLSKDGLSVSIDIGVIYRIKPSAADKILTEVNGDVKDTLIVPYTRGILRDIVSQFDATELYNYDSKLKIASELKFALSEKLVDYVIVEDTIVRDTVLPESVKSAIESKLQAKQDAERIDSENERDFKKKENELKLEEKSAEIERVKAQGIADANQIISESITKEYLQYKFIEGLNDGNTEVIYVPTEANIPIMEASRLN